MAPAFFLPPSPPTAAVAARFSILAGIGDGYCLGFGISERVHYLMS